MLIDQTLLNKENHILTHSSANGGDS